MKTHCLLLALFACCAARLTAAEPPPVLELPPHLVAAGTVAEVGGHPWGYLVWNATTPEWLATRDIAVYRKPASAGAFEPAGVMGLLTDASAIPPWIGRAEALGQDSTTAAAVAAAVHAEWQNPASPEPLPAALKDRLAALAQRAKLVPGAAAALYQLGNAYPVFRFISGTGWGGPLGVANGQQVVFELRERDRTTGAEGGVVGRVTLTAGAPVALEFPGAPVQVPPEFLPLLPLPGELPLAVPRVSTQTDLGVALRWPVPEALRRQLLLTRGFHVWRLQTGYTPPGGLTGQALFAAESGDPALVRRLTRVPAAASKIFTDPAGSESGPRVDDFAADRETWFVVDDNQRYKTGADPTVVIGTPYTEGAGFDYVVAAIDLLGRPGPVSPRGSGVAVHTVPPPVPEVLRVENIMKNGGQRLRVVWKPNPEASGAVSTTHYLVYRDRVKNTAPAADALERSAHRGGHDALIYLGAVPQPASPGDTLTFDDDALVPQPADFGATYFYCLRAVHLGPLGYNISSPSPAVFGTLRDREGPPAPEGYAAGDCARIGLAFEETGPNPLSLGKAQVAPDEVVIRLEARRGTTDGAWRDVQWVIFAVINLDSPFDWSHLSPYLYFGAGDQVWGELKLGTSNSGYAVYALAATSTGHAGHLVGHTLVELGGGHRYRISARALGAPTLEMATPGQPFAEFWTPYFLDSFGAPTVQAVSPAAATPGTFAATFAGASAGTARQLLVQRRQGGGDWTHAAAPLLPANSTQYYFPDPQLDPNPAWQAWEIIEPGGAPPPGSCPHHARPANASQAAPVNIVLLLPPGAHEYRLYRRINQGPLALLRQDAEAWDASTVQAVMHADALIPPAGGRIGYYGQVFDEHGNPSPLKLLGEKITAVPELPTPVLDPPQSGGTLAAPAMTVRAACPSPGVERIELAIDPTPAPTAPLVSEAIPAGQLIDAPTGEIVDLTHTLLTPLALEQDPAVPVTIESTLSVDPKAKYTVRARALGAGGGHGEWCAPASFTWTPPIVGESVAWPARPLPKLVAWNPQVRAFRMLDEHFTFQTYRVVDKYPPAQYPVGIRLGRIPLKSPTPLEYDPASNWDIRGVRTPMAQFTHVVGYFGIANATGFPAMPTDPRMMHQFLAPRLKQYGDVTVPDFSQSLLPCVLYRRQTARAIDGATLPTPDTDIIQASPMINAISWAYDPPGTPDLALFIDPLVSAAMLEPGGSPLAADLCLFDNSPVADGATYQYYLVHFNAALDPDLVIDAGTLTFPEEP
jgi:hypothetical protein